MIRCATPLSLYCISSVYIAYGVSIHCYDICLGSFVDSSSSSRPTVHNHVFWGSGFDFFVLIQNLDSLTGFSKMTYPSFNVSNNLVYEPDFDTNDL